MSSQCEILSRKKKNGPFLKNDTEGRPPASTSTCNHLYIHIAHMHEYTCMRYELPPHIHTFTLAPSPSALMEFSFHLQLMVHMKIFTEGKLPILKVLISFYYLLYVRSSGSCLPSSFFFLYWEKKMRAWYFGLTSFVSEILFVAPEGTTLQLQDCFKLQWPSIKCKNLLFGGKFYILTSNFRMSLYT